MIGNFIILLVKIFTEKQRQRHLKRQLRKTKRAALAEGATKNILVQWRAFDSFCIKYNRHEWPTSTDTLCLFAQHLAKMMRSVKSIEAYLYSVVKLHQYANASPPNMKDFHVQLTLKGIRQKLNHTVKQAKPLTPELLLKIRQVLDMTCTENRVFWAILLTGFFLLLRKSNLVPDNCTSFNPNRQLCRKQVEIKKDYVKIIITWAKTIQFKQKKLVLKMFCLKDNLLCPVRAFQQLFERTRRELDQPCFKLKKGKLSVIICYSIS